MKRIFTLLSFAILSTYIYAQPIVSNWVGTGNPGMISFGTPRLDAGMEMPYGVAMDSKGNLWISEEGGFDIYGVVIKMIQTDGTARVRAGGVGENCFRNGASTGARFNQPRGLAVDANDNIYVADFGNFVIRKISKFLSVSSSQTVSVYAGKYADTTNLCYTPFEGYADGTLKTAMFAGPTDIAIDKTTGAMYVTDAPNHCIRKIFNGQVTTVAGHPDSVGFRDGTTANAQFNFPTGVFVASNGDIYVADHNNQRIRKISGNTVSTVVPFNIDNIPDDVWVTTSGDIYFTTKHRICKYSGTTQSTFAGSNLPNDFGDAAGLGTSAKFNNVKCIIGDNLNSGIYYVADQSNHRLKKIVSCATYKPLIVGPVDHQKNDSTYATCTGDTIYLQTKDAYPSYKWSTGDTTRNILRTSSANVYCTVTNSDGCQGTSVINIITISALKPTITPTGPTTFCPGDSVILVGPPDYNWYKWTKDGSLFDEGPPYKQSILVHSADIGVYILTGTFGSCVGSSNPLSIATSTSIVPPINIIYGDTNLCSSDSLLVEALGTFSTYEWKKDGTPTSTTKSLKIKTPGTYTVYVTQAGGCSGTSYPMHVVSLPSPAIPTFTVSHDTLWSSVADAYQWYFNGVKIPGETKRGYIADQSGSYFVEITGSNGCKARSLPTDVILSILELSGGLKFDVYPNPSSGKMIVSGSFKTDGDFNIRVVNMLGKLVYNNNTILKPGKFEKQIDLQGNPSGIYIVIISSNGKQGMMKLILK